MADLSPDAIGKLVQEIDDLRRTAEGTLIDQAQLNTRYNAATAGLLADDGKFDPAAWKNLAAADQATREASLTSLRKALGNWEQDIPIAANSFMYKRYASNGLILALTLFALVGLILDLWIIHHHWNIATSGKTYSKTSGDNTLPSSTPAIRTPATTSSSTSPILSPIPKATVETPENSLAPSTSAAGIPPIPTVSPVEGTELTGTEKPTEASVLLMVILLGALGGFLHLASSMANYVGNRQLLRSWVVYYFLIPFQGAALAPIVYLLLRVGVLNPANSQPGSASPTASLNLIGIYAFAALTGLFSKQAIEMLADVFATIFKKVSAKDSLEKSKTEI